MKSKDVIAKRTADHLKKLKYEFVKEFDEKQMRAIEGYNPDTSRKNIGYVIVRVGPHYSDILVEDRNFNEVEYHAVINEDLMPIIKRLVH